MFRKIPTLKKSPFLILIFAVIAVINSVLAIFDRLDKSASLIEPRITSIGSEILIPIGFLSLILIEFSNLKWFARGPNHKAVRGMVNSYYTILIGILVTLWLPRGLELVYRLSAPGICGGTPVEITDPTTPTDFNHEFGLTNYRTHSVQTQDQQSLMSDDPRSILVDQTGTWLGVSDQGDSAGLGLLHISPPLIKDPTGQSTRNIEICKTPDGKRIPGTINQIQRGPFGELWVVTDGGGVWMLWLKGWQQFEQKSRSADINQPSQASYSVLTTGTTILIGTIAGVAEFNRLDWIYPGLNYPGQAVVSIAEGPDGSRWFGLLDGGIRRVFPDQSYRDYHAGKELSSDNVRLIFFDRQNRVWVATWGGGIDIFENGVWRTIRAGPRSIPSDNVMTISQDPIGRIWVGTDQGSGYFENGQYHVYDNLDTLAIGFGQVTKEGCLNAFDVWTATNASGLTHSRTPASSVGIKSIRVDGIPPIVYPGEQLDPTITVEMEPGFTFHPGDFLQNVGGPILTRRPLVDAMTESLQINPSTWKFKFNKNPWIAPLEVGKVQTDWRLWQCGRYLGSPIPVDINVQNP
jgi:hypothetical protein